MTPKQLEEHGIVIAVEKRSWHVRHHTLAVASGLIGREWNARNKAKKEALGAATAYFVKLRVENVHRTVDFALLTERQKAIWSKTLWDEMKKTPSIASKFLNAEIVIEMKNIDDIKFIKP